MSDQTVLDLSIRTVSVIKDGDIIQSWCSHHEKSEHVFRPHAKIPLTCLICSPLADPRPKIDSEQE
jgi:hypothetical protein